MSNVTALRMRVLPRYPARVEAANGLTVEREGADLVVKPDFGSLAEIFSVESPNDTYFWTWRAGNGEYDRISFQKLVDNVGAIIIGPNLAGIAEVTSDADKVPFFIDNLGNASVYSVSAYVRSVSGSTDEATFLGAIGALRRTSNLGDLSDVGAAQDNVQLGPSFVSKADVEAKTIPARNKQLTMQYYAPNMASAATLVGRATYRRVATQPTHELKVRSVDRFLPDGTTDNTNGGWWEIADSVLNPMIAGAIGNGQLGASATNDTTALQRVLNFYKLTRPATRQRDNQRRLDLQGKTYRVSSPLSLEGCDGLEICNGTLIVDPSNVFAANRAVLEHDVALTELWGLTTRNLTIQCNQVANGINIQRPQEIFLDNPTVLGWGQREFGIRLGPVAYSADINIVAPCVSGFAVSFADNPVSTRTGIGIDLQTADSEILGGNVNTGLSPIRIHSSGSVRACHVWNGNPGDESLAAPNNIGIDFINGHSSTSCIVGNTIDNCCIVLNGQSLYKQIVGNHFYSNQNQLEAGIFIKASAAGQAIADLLVTDNIFHGNYKRPVIVDQTGGTYTSVQRALVADNPARSFLAGYNSFVESLSATKGSIQVAVSTTHFNANGVVKFNLGARALLLPSYADVLQVSVGHMRNTSGEVSGSSVVFQGWFYDTATGFLWMKFSGAFNGRLMINFDQSYMSRFWDPEPAS